MPSLPNAIVPLLSPFASLFDARTWRKARLIGTVLAPGRRAVCACLRALGRRQCHLDPDSPLVFGLDETSERRSGPHIEAKGVSKGVYRDAVRS